MKRRYMFYVLIAMLMLSGCTSKQEDPSKLQDVEITSIHKQIAQDMADVICEGNIDSLRQDFTYTEEMQEAVQEESFQKQIMTFSKSCGKRKTLNEAYAQTYQGNTIVYQPVIAEHQRFNLQIAFVEDAISGMFFKPYQEKEETMDIEGITQRELPLTIAQGGSMKGYLCRPDTKGKPPVVIMLGGSGPSDHNETIGAQKPFYELAVALAQQGIATYRFDKRTVENTFTQTDTIEQEYVEDALSAIALMKAQEDIDTEQIYLLGHSQGGYILPRIAKQTSDIRGYIFMSAPARPIEDSLIEQIQYLAELDGTINEQEQKQIQEAKQIREQIKHIEDAKNDEVFFGLSRAYLMDLKDYDPVKEAEAIQAEVLLTQGLRDYQVTENDLSLWKQAFQSKVNWTIKTYATANHLMSEGSPKPNPSDYDKKSTLDKQFIKDICDFIKKQ